jgi:hypothetical protein
MTGASGPRRNIVLLRTDSYESKVKAEQLADAARSLGLDVRGAPDRRTDAVLPASDFRALEAAWMAHTYGVPGPDPVMVAIATSKSLTYEFLRRRGFSLLRWLVPVWERDLEVGFAGPVFVKPDCGSGSVSGKPWGYRAFESLADFHRFLRRRKLLARFLEAQRDPRQRHLVMEHVAAREQWSVATVAGDGAPVLYDTNIMYPMAHCSVIERDLVGARHPDTANVVRMARVMATAGLRRSVIYFQCVQRRGRLYPMDLNLRPGTMWSHGAAVMKVGAHEEILAVLLGLKAKPSIAWPAPYVGFARVPMRRPARVAAQFRHPQALPLIERTHLDPSRPYDLGHAWPMFAVLCERPRDFARKAGAILASTRLTRLPGSRSGSRRSARSSSRAARADAPRRRRRAA